MNIKKTNKDEEITEKDKEYNKKVMKALIKGNTKNIDSMAAQRSDEEFCGLGQKFAFAVKDISCDDDAP